MLYLMSMKDILLTAVAVSTLAISRNSYYNQILSDIEEDDEKLVMTA